jgi:hypothetical protein
VLDRTYYTDATLGAGTRRFIDSHVTWARSDPQRHRCYASKIRQPARRRKDGIDFADR